MTKGIFRVVTTAVGGAAAVAVMARPSIASNPYILSAILLAFDFLVALWMASQFKYAGDACARAATTVSHHIRHHRSKVPDSPLPNAQFASMAALCTDRHAGQNPIY
jgi:hypothetical protein